MSRTSKTLLRLGVPSLAAATLVAGVPAFLGTAQAAAVQSFTIAPVDGASSAAGACQAFVITGSRTSGTTVGETINVTLTDTADDDDADSAFCTLPTTTDDEQGDAQGDERTFTPAAGTVISAGGPQADGGSVDQSRFTLGANTTGVAANAGQGQVVIGVTRNEAGGPVNLRVYQDLNGNNTFDAAANEVQASASTTFTAGGTDGSNANQNAVTTVDARQVTEDDDTDADTVFVGESRTYRVFAGNGTDPVQGATVNYVVRTEEGGVTTTSAPTAAGVTDNDGFVTATVTIPNDTAGQIIFYVNQSNNGPARADDPATADVNEANTGTTTGPDTDEPRDTITLTIRPAQTASSIQVVALEDTDDNETQVAYSNEPAINPRTDGDREFRVIVDNTSATTSSVGRAITVTVSGGDGDETVTFAGGDSGRTADGATTALDAGSSSTTDSFVDVVVNDPDAATNSVPSNQVLTVTAVVRGQAASDAETLTYVAVPADARNITLTPDPAFTPAGQARTFTARVVDFRGNAVVGVPVTFTEDGPGAFRDGSSEAVDVTDRSGLATIETFALQGESGQQTITATMPATTFTDDEAGDTPGTTTAGNRRDTAVNNVAVASPTPTQATATPTATSTATATPTSTATPGVVQCVNPAGISLSRAFTIPGQPVTVNVTAPAGADIELQAYSRPSTTFAQVRRTQVPANGQVSFDVLPGTNTRLFAQCVGQTRSASASTVINVRTALSLTVVRNGRRNYTFQGRILPRRAGQLITLYRVTNQGERVLTSQIKTDASGTYRINRVFTGSGTFGFLTRTGQTLTNAAGESTSAERQRSTEYLETGRGTARPTAIF